MYREEKLRYSCRLPIVQSQYVGIITSANISSLGFDLNDFGNE